MGSFWMSPFDQAYAEFSHIAKHKVQAEQQARLEILRNKSKFVSKKHNLNRRGNIR